MDDSLYVCETSLFKSVSVKITDRRILMNLPNFTMYLRDNLPASLDSNLAI